MTLKNSLMLVVFKSFLLVFWSFLLVTFKFGLFLFTFHLLQWNANNLKTNGTEFKLVVDSLKPDIVCIQETFLTSRDIFDIPGYNCIRRDRGQGAGGGVATLIKNGIPYVLDSQAQDLEYLSVHIKSGGQNILVTNIYIPNNKYHRVHPLDEIKEVFLKPNSVICGDLNGKNTLWGSPASDPWGIILEDIITDSNLVVLNNGSGTRMDFSDPDKISHLDLTLASPNIATTSSWEVLDENCGSDHFLIETTVGSDILQNEPFIPKWNFNKADWGKFKSISEENLIAVNKQIFDNIEHYNEEIISAIFSAAVETIPKSKINDKKPVPFWTAECTEAVKARKRAQRRVIKTRNPKDYIEYKHTRALARRVIKSAKKKYWEQYCSTLSHRTDINKVWKTIRNITRAGTNRCTPQLKINNRPVFDSKEKADIFAKQFAFVSSTENYSDPFKDHKTQFEQQHDHIFLKRNNDNSSFNSEFSIDEFQQALSKCKNTSPGDDQLCYLMFKHMSKTSLSIVLEFLNKIWGEGVIPQSWKLSVVVPLLKPGKDKSQPVSYRPIALTSNFSKLMERMVTSRLTWYLENNNLLNINQSGFRKNKRTLDQLIRLSNTIQKGLAGKKYTLGVFLDVEKAYDMVWKKGILYKLHEMGISGNMFNWINSFLHGRTLKTRVGNTFSDMVDVDNGTPQGSTISPILFLVAINDLKVRPDVQLSMFADDTAVWMSGGSVETIQTKIQSALDEIKQWCDLWGYKISVAKTQAILFTDKAKPEVHLTFNKVPLKIVDQVKFLGLIFDSKLTWADHIQYIVDKCKGRMNLLRCISGLSWGPSKDTLCHIYKALIRSRIDYGCQIYATANDETLKKLDIIQNKCLQICSGSLRGTPINTLEVDCGVMPLDLRRKKLQANIVSCYLKSENNPVSECLQPTWWDDYKYRNKNFQALYKSVQGILNPEEFQIKEVSVFKTPPWEFLSPCVDISLTDHLSKKDPVQIIKALTLEFIGSWKDYLHIYTDGSKTSTKCTAAFYIPDLKVSKAVSISDNGNNFDAEVVALIKALEWLEHTNISKCVLFSDSLSALQAIQSKDTQKSCLLQELFYWLCNLQHLGISVSFAWIPGHAGLKGNEMADWVAKQHSSESFEVLLPNSKTFVTGSIEHLINEMWQERWDKGHTGRFYYNIQKQVSEKVKCPFLYNRSKEVALTRLRSGHCLLNKFKHLFKIIDSPNCTVCKVEETVEHFLMDCVKQYQLKLDLDLTLALECEMINLGNILNSKGCLEQIWVYLTQNNICI